jgi:uncharacterized membrane protein YphA (DoxX/SURF4 family)
VTRPGLRGLYDETDRAPDIGGWVLRIGLGIAFVFFGLDKFSADPRNFYTIVFNQIGFGDWFRFATGVIEIAGGLLFIPPRTYLVGAAMLGTTMAGASLVHIVVRHRPGDSVFTMIILVAIVTIAARQYGRPKT